MLHDGITADIADYAKTSPTLLTYNGASLPASTGIEIRRKTPNNVVRVVSYGDRFSSDHWNEEFDRMVRWREEADLNGVGAGSLVTVATPQDDAFGVSWDSDVLFPATRNALYDKFTSVDAAIASNDVDIAAINAVLPSKAPLASPALTGNPTAPTQATSDSTAKIATTAYVKSQDYVTATTANSTYGRLGQANTWTANNSYTGSQLQNSGAITLGGSATLNCAAGATVGLATAATFNVPTWANNRNDASVASTAWVRQRIPYDSASFIRNSESPNVTVAGAWQNMNWNATVGQTTYVQSLGGARYTVTFPVSCYILVTGSLYVTNKSGSTGNFWFALARASVKEVIGQAQLGHNEAATLGGSFAIIANAGEVMEFQIFGSHQPYTFGNASAANRFFASIVRLE